MGIRYTGINRLLNYFPPLSVKCKNCFFEFDVRMGEVRYSRKKFNGPFCPKCGSRAMNKKGGKTSWKLNLRH